MLRRTEHLNPEPGPQNLSTPNSRWDVILGRAYLLASTHKGSDPAMRLVIVGGGAGGVELALSMQARLQKEFMVTKPP